MANGKRVGANGVIQYRTSATDDWKSLKNVTTDGDSLDRYRYTTTQKRSYRVVFPNQPFIWGSASEASATV